MIATYGREPYASGGSEYRKRYERNRNETKKACGGAIVKDRDGRSVRLSLPQRLH